MESRVTPEASEPLLPGRREVTGTGRQAGVPVKQAGVSIKRPRTIPRPGPDSS